MLFSVVVPIWKRPKELELLLDSLNNQAQQHEILIEVILSDSNSGLEIDKVISKAIVENKNLKIIHIQTQNIVAAKRNVGTYSATGDYLIYLDDDCIPDEAFISDCIENIGEINSEKIVICGEVRFVDSMVNKSNYYRYRDFQHPHFSKEIKLKLNAWSFVSMNYMLSRKALLLAQISYGEEFYGYGAEDHDYGYQLCKSGFKIVQGKQKIWHHEYGGSIDKYAIKIYHTARDGMLNLKNVNNDLYRNSSRNINLVEKIFSKKNLLSLILYYLFFNNLFYSFVVFILNRTDTNKVFYVYSLFRYVILRSYVKGVLDRVNVDKNKLIGNWYN